MARANDVLAVPKLQNKDRKDVSGQCRHAMPESDTPIMNALCFSHKITVVGDREKCCHLEWRDTLVNAMR